MTQMVRYDPVYDTLRPMTDILDAFFAPIEKELLAPEWFSIPRRASSGFGNLPLDMYETDDELVIEAMLPGFTEDEIEVTEENGAFSIRARHEEEREESGAAWFVKERREQHFERTIPLPVEVESDKAKAVLEKGVLRVTFPKVHTGKSPINRIKVSVPKLKLPKIGRKESKVTVKKR